MPFTAGQPASQQRTRHWCPIDPQPSAAQHVSKHYRARKRRPETYLDVQDSIFDDHLAVAAVLELVDDAERRLGLVDGLVEAFLQHVVVVELLRLHLPLETLKVALDVVPKARLPVGVEAVALALLLGAQLGEGIVPVGLELEVILPEHL